jgi:signal transduction histidine kinase
MPRKLLNLAVGVLTLIIIVGAFSSFQRKRSSFERLDFQYQRSDGTIRVESVVPGSGAEQAGLRPGDEILAIGNQPAGEVGALKRSLRELGSVVLIVSRGGITRAVNYQAPAVRVDYQYLFLTFIGFLYLAIGLFTLLHGARDESLLFYFVTLLAFIVYAYSPAGDIDDAYKVMYLTEDLARTFLPALSLHFFLRFPQRLFRGWKTLAAVYALPIVLALWSIDVFLLHNVVRVASERTSILLIDRWQLLHFAVYFTLAFVALTYTYRTSSAAGQRKQIKWIYLGMGVGFIPFLVLYLVPYILRGTGTALTNLAILPLALIPLAFAVSILRYKLWDVEVVIKEVLAYTATILIGVIAFSGINVLLSRLIEEHMALERNFLTFTSGLLIAGVLVPVKGRIETLVEMVLYRDTYRHRRAMIDFASELATYRDLHELLDLMRERLYAATRMTRMNLYLRDGASFMLYENEGTLPPFIWERDFPPFINTRPLLLDAPRLPDPSEVPMTLLRSGYRAVYPLRHRGEILGLLLCGAKRGDEALARDDLQLIASLTPSLALAIENARLYGRLRRQLDEIRTLKEYNENIIESSLSAIAVIAADGTLLTANRAFWEITGLSPDTEKTVEDIFPGYVRPEREGTVAEVSYVNDHNEHKVLTITSSRFIAPDVPSNAVVLVIADVSERAQLQRQLEEKERLASLGLLAAGVAHEVNTPLTGISSYAQLLLADTAPGDKHYPLLKKMEQQTFRASHLVNNLLNFAANRQQNSERVSLREVIRSTVTIHDDLLKAKNLEVQIDDPEDLFVIGSFYELQQVVTNLLLNAKEAVADRGEIHVTLRRAGDCAEITVRDNGRGIPPEMLDEIFKPLVTTRRGQGGTGLGLAIVERIVHAHDGSVEVASEPGKGATFVVRLRLAPESGKRSNA